MMKDSLNGVSQLSWNTIKSNYPDLMAKEKGSLLNRKLFQEHLIQKEDSQFTFRFDPLFIFEGGNDSRDSLNRLYRNSRGVQVSGSIGKSFEFHSAFLENQAIFPQHVRSFVALREVSPGLGRTKIFKVNGSDFGLAWAGFSLKIKSWLKIEGGHGKSFIGSGYRSLILSDNSFFYPYLKGSINKKKWSYTQNWSMLQDINLGREIFNPLSEPLFVRKLFSWQYFTFHPSPKMEAGIFYSTIQTHSNASAIVPLPFAHHLQKYPSGSVNSLAGLNLSCKIMKSMMIYSQVMMDGSLSERQGKRNSKLGLQIGGIVHQPFGIKGLILQGEINTVEAGAYSQANPGHDYHNGYFHYNQSLTHPLGSNFTEGIGIVNYRIKRLFVNLKGSYFSRKNSAILSPSDVDPVAENNGISSVIAPNFYPNKGLIADNKIGYILNPATGLKAYCGMLYRNTGSGMALNYIYLGIGTQILNQYFDF